MIGSWANNNDVRESRHWLSLAKRLACEVTQPGSGQSESSADYITLKSDMRHVVAETINELVDDRKYGIS